MKEYIIANKQVPINENVKVEFRGLYLSQGYSSKGPWAKLVLRFSQNTNWLESVMWQPTQLDSIQMYEETRNIAMKISELFTVLGEDFKEIKPNKIWDRVYSDIVRINNLRGETVYIKTLPLPGKEWVDKREVDVLKTCLADKNFISRKPDLKYTPLEINSMESFDLLTESFEVPENIGNVKGLLNIPF